MDNTLITYEEVRNDAKEIKNCAQSMNTIFDDFITTMNSVLTYDNYAGEASETLENKFNQLKTKLNNYTETVKSFSDTILNSANETERTENIIKDNASVLPQ